ncbi:MAG TPA: FAD-dependent oxidoreductase [Candidatus Limnocylindrales bacterium]
MTSAGTGPAPPTRALPKSADVVVIGGGIAGTATAAFLAEAGASVVLVERDAIAGGASGRNSGVVQAPIDPVLAALYRESVTRYRALEDAAVAPFALPREPAGLLYVSRDATLAKRLAEELAARAPELQPEYLDPEAVHALEPSIDPSVAACRLEIGYPVAPGAATTAYAELAAARGALVAVAAPASIVRDGRRAVGARVGDRQILAPAVVLAAGPWTPGIVDPTGRWCPIRRSWGVVAEIALPEPPGHVLEEAELDEAIEPGGEALPGYGFSLVTAAGRSVLGSTFLEREPDAASIVPELQRRGARFVPAIADAPVVSSRRCARPVSDDGRPLVGRIPWLDRLYVVAGHGPWGISTGPGSAAIVADLVLGRRSDPPPELDPGRFG